MSVHRSELKAIVCDLSNAGYRASDIARALNRSHERIRQLLRDMQMSPPRLQSIDDLPHDLRERVHQFRDSDNPSVVS